MEKTEEKKDIIIEVNPIFEPLFYDNLDDPRYYQVYGGRGSGKSFAVALAMVEKTYSPYCHKILYLRQVMSSSEDSTIADIANAIKIRGADKDFTFKKGVFTNKKTGSTIIFKGIRSSGNQTAKLKSLSGVTTLVVEEAEELENFEEFSKVDESIRLKGKPLKVIMIYNPTSSVTSWIFKEWFQGSGIPKRERVGSDTIYLHSTYLDNLVNLNESVIKRYESLKDTNPLYYKNVILAEWTLETEGRIYAGWGEVDFFDNDGDVWYGLDFGYGGKDKTSLIKLTFFEEVYYIEEMFSESKLRIRDVIQKMEDRNIPKNAKIYADSAMPMLLTEIREAGFKSIRKASKGNKEAGIKKVQNKDIVMVGGRNSGLYNSYIGFRREANGSLKHEPDELAALRYGIISRRPIKNKGKVPIKRRKKIGGYI